MQEIKKIFSKIKIWFIERYHLLFKSAADNHLRIQELAKNADGTYQVTFKFASYSELKRYQKKFRRMTVSLSTSIAMILVAFLVAPYIMSPNKSAASTFLFKQTTWNPTANTGVVATYPGDNNDFKNYYAKNGSISLTANDGTGKLTLTEPTSQATSDSTYGAVTDTANTYLAANAVSLRKPAGAVCANASECANGWPCTNFSGVLKCEAVLNFYGSTSAWIVPAGVSFIDVEVAGDAGTSGYSAGGKGGNVKATIAVNAGETLDIWSATYGVAGAGTYMGSNNNAGKSGGRASAILRHVDGSVLVVGGGGGGGGGRGDSYPDNTFGIGGCSQTDGINGRHVGVVLTGGGKGVGGALTNAGGGGLGGTYSGGAWGQANGNAGSSGNLSSGGDGGYAAISNSGGGGGGGGGYFGGGGGGGGGKLENNYAGGGGGGGGSNYSASSNINTAIINCANASNGYVKIKYTR